MQRNFSRKMCFRVLLIAAFMIVGCASALAQPSSTDLSSVSKKLQKTCREATARQMSGKTKDIKVTSVSLDRMAFRTLFLTNKRTAKEARCQINPSNNQIVKLDLAPYEDMGSGGSGGSSSAETILEFQTKTYRVKVIREASGRTLMSVYNKGTDKAILQDNPAVSFADTGFTEYQSCTTNRNPCDGTGYNARLTDSGQKSLTIKQKPNSTGVTEGQIQ